MKHNPLRITLVIALAFAGALDLKGLEFDAALAAGRNELIAQNLPGARDAFASVLLSDPQSEKARVAYAACNLVLLYEHPSVQSFLDRWMFTPEGRDVYAWTSWSQYEDAGIYNPLPDNANLEELATLTKNAILPRLADTIFQLGQVTSPDFELYIRPEYFGQLATGEVSIIDYTDVQLLRSGLLMLSSMLRMGLLADNMNIPLTGLRDLSLDNLTTIESILTAYPGLGTLKEGTQRTAARNELKDAIESYTANSESLRDPARRYVNLFFLETEWDLLDEAEFKDILTHMNDALSGPVSVGEETSPTTVDLRSLFNPTLDFRPLLPEFRGNLVEADSMPDPTLYGILPDFSQAYLTDIFAGMGLLDYATLLWSRAAPGPDGWLSLSWFGKFANLGSNWVYHVEHGWLHAIGMSTDSMSFYDAALACWWWCSDGSYPFLYKTGINEGWYGYRRGGSPGARAFYRYSDNKWVEEKDINSALFVRIPAGSFTMGSPPDELGRNLDERQREVTLTRSFDLQQTPVTIFEWHALLDHATPLGYTDLPYGPIGTFGVWDHTLPVTWVSWFDVVKWLNLKSELDGLTPCYTVSGEIYKTGQSVPDCDFSANGYRLPTEAEWEYACRAGTTTAFYSGDISQTGAFPVDPNLDAIGWYQGNSSDVPQAVGQKQPNAFGLFDMSGTVSEWCSDWYWDYPEGSVTDPTGPQAGFSRVRRGGRWFDFPDSCRSASRRSYDPIFRDYGIGFRPARTVSP